MAGSTISYPVSLKAIDKWNHERLELIEQIHEYRHYRFRYNGSSCTDGGAAFLAYLHAEVSGTGKKLRLRRAWIDIPMEEREAASKMCAASRSGATAFFASLSGPFGLEGRLVEEYLSEEAPVNYAGCFCAPPMLRDKWNMVLSTIHFRESENGS